MAPTSVETYTIGVFKDLAWATRGVDALERQGFPRESLSLIATDTPETAPLLKRLGGRPDALLDLPGLGRCIATGPLIATLQQETSDLTHKGLAVAMKHAGFQAHDGRIYETLAQRGGILIAVRSEPRAADALATLQAYGGGNAAIGAWHGRL
jgi:hypothetical protein